MPLPQRVSLEHFLKDSSDGFNSMVCCRAMFPSSFANRRLKPTAQRFLNDSSDGFDSTFVETASSSRFLALEFHW